MSHNQVYGQLSSLGQGIIGQGDDEGDALSEDEDPTAAAKLSLITALDHAEQVKAITVWDKDEDTLIFSGDNMGVLIYWSVSASYDSTAASTGKASSSSSPEDKSREGKGKGKGEKMKVRTAVLIPLRKIPDPNKKGIHLSSICLCIYISIISSGFCVYVCVRESVNVCECVCVFVSWMDG